MSKANLGIVGAFATVAMVGAVVTVPDTARAVDTMTPPTATAPAPPRPAAGPVKKKPSKATRSKKSQQKSEQKFLDGYRAAHALIYQRGEYEAGIGALRALGHDTHPDVANLIGFASRKLGRYDDARHWYEAALAADPNHARTWSYYGMWHAEQGNLLKAQDYLGKVASLCGTSCREYTELKGVIEGTATY